MLSDVGVFTNNFLLFGLLNQNILASNEIILLFSEMASSNLVLLSQAVSHS